MFRSFWSKSGRQRATSPQKTTKQSGRQYIFMLAHLKLRQNAQNINVCTQCILTYNYNPVTMLTKDIILLEVPPSLSRRALLRVRTTTRNPSHSAGTVTTVFHKAPDQPVPCWWWWWWGNRIFISLRIWAWSSPRWPSWLPPCQPPPPPPPLQWSPSSQLPVLTLLPPFHHLLLVVSEASREFEIALKIIKGFCIRQVWPIISHIIIVA